MGSIPLEICAKYVAYETIWIFKERWRNIYMTVKELKDFIKDCDDNDLVTICSCPDDNPISDYYDIGIVYKINMSNDSICQICMMPQ